MTKSIMSQLRELDTRLEGTEPPAQFDAQLEHLFEVVPSAVVLQSLDGTVVRSNKRAADLFGFVPDGKRGQELYRDHERRAVLDSQVIATGIPRRGELHEFTRSDGRKVWLLTDRIAHHDSLGRIDGVLVFLVDVTSVVVGRR